MKIITYWFVIHSCSRRSCNMHYDQQLHIRTFTVINKSVSFTFFLCLVPSIFVCGIFMKLICRRAFSTVFFVDQFGCSTRRSFNGNMHFSLQPLHAAGMNCAFSRILLRFLWLSKMHWIVRNGMRRDTCCVMCPHRHPTYREIWMLKPQITNWRLRCVSIYSQFVTNFVNKIFWKLLAFIWRWWAQVI